MHDDDILWGCGIIKPMALPKCQGVKIPMVRGHYTKFGLKLSGYDVESTIFGDPCQLLPEMMPRKRTDDYMIGVVSHYIEESESRATFKGDEFHHINIISDVDTFVSEINKCAVVISSSLHGIIISEAYDIPTHFYQLTDKVIGGEFKFQDYYWGQNRHFVNLRKYDPMSVS
jgi:pyruvyltransferase